MTFFLHCLLYAVHLVVTVNAVYNATGIPEITEMSIETNISNRYATTLIIGKVKNLHWKPLEAIFRPNIPDAALISSFVMDINGQKYPAHVEEKERAHKTYNKSASAAPFTVSVNLQVGSQAIFYLTYEELLVWKKGRYELILKLPPTQPVKRLNVTVRIEEPRPLKFVNGSFSGTANAARVDIVKESNGSIAIVNFNTDEASRTSGQFAVRYDVERDNRGGGGEVLVNGDYFAHFFAPEPHIRKLKQVIFVLDTSGSMCGNKLKSLKKTLESILAKLKPEDLFSLVTFNSYVTIWDIESYKTCIRDRRIRDNGTLVGSVVASRQNLVKAKAILATLKPAGMTNIYAALEASLKIVQTNTQPTKYKPIVVLLTDGHPSIGIASRAKIVSKITELNGNRTPIITLDVSALIPDWTFLSHLSSKNHGYYRPSLSHLDTFFKERSTPALDTVAFRYGNATNVTRSSFSKVFNGSELFVSGMVVDPLFFRDQTVDAWSAETAVQFNQPKIYRVSSNLERLWAYVTIKQALERKAQCQSFPEALRLALKYSFVTAVTSLVVVKPDNSTSVVDIPETSNTPKGSHKKAPNVSGDLPFLRLEDIAKKHSERGLFIMSLLAEFNSSEKSKDTWLEPYHNRKIVIDSAVYSFDFDGDLPASRPCNNTDWADGTFAPMEITERVCSLVKNCEKLPDSTGVISNKHFCVMDEVTAGICCPMEKIYTYKIPERRKQWG